MSQGRREYQEDALVTDFPVGEDTGLVVLADGMGGHAAGDVASNIVVTEVYGALKRSAASFLTDANAIPEMLSRAAARANASVRDHVKTNPQTEGMGATLVALSMIGDRMFWNSIGDSPLYLLRNGKLRQLNEDHSMAPQIDMMVQAGLLDADAAKNHPDRNCLTSVIFGQKVPKVDCPNDPFHLEAGDIVVVSSDGLQFLEEPTIERILNKNRKRQASEIAGILLNALENLREPNQDNISFAIVKVNHTAAVRADPVMAMPAERPLAATRLADMSKLADLAQGLFSSKGKTTQQAAPRGSGNAAEERFVSGS
ncbi:MAG: protein phosphatase 2C domain-containing protein [Pseudomonadota bacterium]